MYFDIFNCSKSFLSKDTTISSNLRFPVFTVVTVFNSCTLVNMGLDSSCMIELRLLRLVIISFILVVELCTSKKLFISINCA